MSTIQKDFDRIALVSEDGATHNDHYHYFLLRHLPSNCHDVLEIGCGRGAFARRLAERSQHVLALDLSGEMIRIARERSAQFSNIEFQLADVRDVPFHVWELRLYCHDRDPSSPAVSRDIVENEGGTETRWSSVGPRSIRASRLIGFTLEPFGSPSERHAEVDTLRPPATTSRSARRLDRTRAPRFLPDDERGACTLRVGAAWRQD
jgi:SAM-dependent methyltransferase